VDLARVGGDHRAELGGVAALRECPHHSQELGREFWRHDGDEAAFVGDVQRGEAEEITRGGDLGPFAPPASSRDRRGYGRWPAIRSANRRNRGAGKRLSVAPRRVGFPASHAH
jgi:hypothetical protein